MSWYWREIEDKDSAEDATRPAAGISFFVAALTGLLAVLSLVYHKPVFGLDGYSLVDAALFAVVGWRIRRLSRPWAVIGLCLYLVEAVVSLGTRGTGIGILTIVFVIAYVNAVRGTFAYHKHAKNEPIQAGDVAPSA
jgi:hypothetical protein